MINDWAGNYSVNEIIDILEEKGIPVAPINELDQIVNDPHIAVAREMIQKIVHPIVGEVDVVGNPIKMSDTPPSIYASSPMLGEHTDEILKKYIT